MQTSNQTLLLERAELMFLKGAYTDALRRYGLIFKDHPTLDEAKMGVYLSDLGSQSSKEAQALFDYYQAIKKEKLNAVEIVCSIIDTLEHTKYKLEELLVKPMKEEAQYIDGIQYADFLTLVKSKGSFRETFEDIMFSTKVVLSNKDEFMDFVQRLSAEGFDEMALKYLDASTHLFGNDQEVLALYHVVQGVKK